MPRRAVEKSKSSSAASEKPKQGRASKKSDGRPAGRKKRRRKSSWDYEDDDGDVAFEAEESGSESEEKRAQLQKKRSRAQKTQVNKKTKTVGSVSKKKVLQDDKEGLEDQDGSQEEQERVLLEEKRRRRKQQYEQESGQMLKEVRDLALHEKKTQEKLIGKLKRDITTLSKQAEEERKKHKKEVDKLVADKMREYDANQRTKDDGDVEKIALREHIRELESQFASFKRSTGPDDVVTVNAAAVSAASVVQNSEASIQLDQANKLLKMYRLVTSMDIRLIQSTDDDEQDGDDCTEIACTITDSATGNQFEFELAIPATTSSEIEYLPSEKPPTGIKVPSYLREELSFSRSEMTKFSRSVLDIVIRKKKS
uniref:Monopolin complex subunit Csm1/Pcs1 C-terminal domain-containing protein n=1 Tax=Peronospora matthiolae TaxID=2874970 RepID=A0AAV1T1U5_9STRA